MTKKCFTRYAVMYKTKSAKTSSWRYYMYCELDLMLATNKTVDDDEAYYDEDDYVPAVFDDVETPQALAAWMQERADRYKWNHTYRVFRINHKEVPVT